MEAAALVSKIREKRSIPAPRICRLLRRAAGLSQQEIADAIGVHRTTVARWESGTRRPVGDIRVRYDELLRIPGLSRLKPVTFGGAWASSKKSDSEWERIVGSESAVAAFEEAVGEIREDTGLDLTFGVPPPPGYDEERLLELVEEKIAARIRRADDST